MNCSLMEVIQALHMDDILLLTVDSMVRYSDSRQQLQANVVNQVGRGKVPSTMLTAVLLKYSPQYSDLTSWASEFSCAELAHPWLRNVDRNNRLSLSSCMRMALTFAQMDGLEVTKTLPLRDHTFVDRIAYSLVDMVHRATFVDYEQSIDILYSMDLYRRALTLHLSVS